MKKTFLFISFLLFSTWIFASDDYVWWEGESAEKHNFSNTHFSVSWLKNKNGLSNSNWLNNGGKRGKDEIFAIYQVRVPATAVYDFWARKFWKHGPFRWRFDKSEWKACGRDIALADSFEFQTHICANWVHLGKVKLSRGLHRFELRLMAKQRENATACFDCFLLTTKPFTPRGKLKPGHKSGKSEDGWWAFEPDPDTFSPDAMLDLGYLNEKTAGESGFIKSANNGFQLGSGEPVRFWGVNCGPGIVRQSREQVDYLARRLAKCGVNMVRFHGPVFDRSAQNPSRVDRKFLDQLFYFVTAMKKQGIYSKISFYFPLWFDIKPEYGIRGYESIKNKKPFAAFYFNPKLIEIYRSWAKVLFTTRNPYSGRTLAADPCVGIVEIVNEDSCFFWTFSETNIPEPQLETMEKAFASWLKNKYGSPQKAAAAWPRTRHKRDNTAGGRIGLFDAWHMTAKGMVTGAPDKAKRMSDQVRFLAEHQRQFYASMKDYFRTELKIKSLISASNWKTADPLLLDALERYTYTACDVIDQHGYFGGKHTGPRSSYSVSTNDTFEDRAGVLVPDALPIQFIQYNGYPHIISEIGWTMPNRLRADNTFLCSAYGALQGVDGFFFFAVNSPDWQQTPVKFPVSVPSVLGQFPACALQYRRGDIAESEPVIHQALSLAHLFALKGSEGAASQNLDNLRKKDIPEVGRSSENRKPSIDPLTFFAGKISRSFYRGKSTSLNLSKRINRLAKTIQSQTRELNWDYGNGLVTVNTPKSQGITGFLKKAGPVELTDVIIDCDNTYASIQVISLDNKPLATSAKILIQAFTREQTYGWKSDRNGRILSLGTPPLNVENIQATVTLKKTPTNPSATVLDINGYPIREIKESKTKTRLKIQLPRNALYTIVQKYHRVKP